MVFVLQAVQGGERGGFKICDRSPRLLVLSRDFLWGFWGNEPEGVLETGMASGQGHGIGGGLLLRGLFGCN